MHTHWRGKRSRILHCFQVLFGLSFRKKYQIQNIFILVEKWIFEVRLNWKETHIRCITNVLLNPPVHKTNYQHTIRLQDVLLR